MYREETKKKQFILRVKRHSACTYLKYVSSPQSTLKLLVARFAGEGFSTVVTPSVTTLVAVLCQVHVDSRHVIEMS